MVRWHGCSRGWLAMLLSGAFVACGSVDEAPKPSGPPMGAARTVEAEEGNLAPLIERVRLNPAEPVAGVTVNAVVDVSDPEGDPVRLTYEWRVNGEVVSSGPKPAVSVPDLRRGDRLEVRVVATDGRAESEPRRADARVANRPPFVEGVAFTPPTDVRPGETLFASPSASDPDGDELRFEYTWFVNGAERGRDREFSTEGLRRGDRIGLRVVAHDGEAQSRPHDAHEIVVGNSPPRIRALPRLDTDSGEFRYAFEATDADADRNLRFWLEHAPDGMTIDPILGVVSWRPAAEQTGVHPVEVGVKDDHGDATTFGFEVTVNASVEDAGSSAPPAAPAR